jgi:hypothetical protein
VADEAAVKLVVLKDFGFPFYFLLYQKPRKQSRFSDRIRATMLRGRSSSSGRIKNFEFFTSSRPVLGPIQPSMQWIPEYFPPEVKRHGREAHHSPPISVYIKKVWIYTSTASYFFMA